MDFILNNYGVDWIAMVLTLYAVYLLGNKKRSGFVVMIFSNAAWLGLAVMVQSIAMGLANVVFVGMNVRGFVKWANTEQG